MPNLGPMELAIIAVVVLLLFGGSKLAGLGKSTGRALREFKEETKGLRDSDTTTDEPAPADPASDDASAAPREAEGTRELTRGPQDDTVRQTRPADDTHRDS